MKTYKNVDEFISDVFPLEFEKIIKQKKSAMEESIERVDTLFIQELEEAIKGKKAEQKEEAGKGKKTEKKEEAGKGKKAEKQE